MPTSPTNLLHLVELFSGLTVEETNTIGELCDWQRSAKNIALISEHEPSDDVFFIVEGRVCAKSYSPQGKEVSYVEISRGGMFGEFSAIDRQARSASIETLEESYTARMTAQNFRNLVATNGTVGLKLSEMLVGKVRELSHRIFEFSTLSVPDRVVAEIIRMARAIDQEANTVVMEQSPSHYELASRLSTHREAVSRVVSELASKGLIETGRRKLVVLDIKGLKATLPKDER